jgi:hypothetical protein
MFSNSEDFEKKVMAAPRKPLLAQYAQAVFSLTCPSDLAFLVLPFFLRLQRAKADVQTLTDQNTADVVCPRCVSGSREYVARRHSHLFGAFLFLIVGRAMTQAVTVAMP